jgi:hypothetical protein
MCLPGPTREGAIAELAPDVLAVQDVGNAASLNDLQHHRGARTGDGRAGRPSQHERSDRSRRQRLAQDHARPPSARRGASRGDAPHPAPDRVAARPDAVITAAIALVEAGATCHAVRRTEPSVHRSSAHRQARRSLGRRPRVGSGPTVRPQRSPLRGMCCRAGQRHRSVGRHPPRRPRPSDPPARRSTPNATPR